MSALIVLSAEFAALTRACTLALIDCVSLVTEMVTPVAGAATENVTPGITPVNVLLALLTV